jgi:hypothetical protein
MLSPLWFRLCRLRDWAPPSFPSHPSMTATSSTTFGDRDRRASTAATGRRIVPSNLGPLLERHGRVFWAGQVSGIGQANAAVGGHLGNSRNRNRVDRGAVGRRFRAGIRGRSKRGLLWHGCAEPSFVEWPNAAARSGYRSGRDRRTALTQKRNPDSGKTGVSQADDRVRGKPGLPSYLANATGIGAVPLRHLAVP